MAPLHSLPPEIIALILANINRRRDLYACTLTNKQFYLLAQPLLWCSPQLHNDTSANNLLTGLTMTLTALPAHHHHLGQWIQKLKLYNNFWTDERLLVLMHHIPHLEELHLIMTTSLSNASLVHLPEHCVQLKTLSLLDVPEITPQFMDALGQHCRQLVKLNLDNCDGDYMFRGLQHCRLQSLGIDARLLQQQQASGTLILQEGLTELKIGGRSDSSNRVWAAAANHGMRHLFSLAVVDTWPHLTSLSINGYIMNNMSDPLVAFLQSHPALEKLYLRRCRFYPRLDPLAGGLATVRLPCLTELHITETYDVCDQAIRQWILVCPQLTFVLLFDCGIDSYIFPGQQRRDCYSLHHLDHEDILRIRLG